MFLNLKHLKSAQNECKILAQNGIKKLKCSLNWAEYYIPSSAETLADWATSSTKNTDTIAELNGLHFLVAMISETREWRLSL